MSRMRLMAFCKAKGRKRQRERPSSAVRKTAFHKLSDYQSVTNHSQIPCPYSVKHRHHAKLPPFGRVGVGVWLPGFGPLLLRLAACPSFLAEVWLLAHELHVLRLLGEELPPVVLPSALLEAHVGLLAAAFRALSALLVAPLRLLLEAAGLVVLPRPALRLAVAVGVVAAHLAALVRCSVQGAHHFGPVRRACCG